MKVKEIKSDEKMVEFEIEGESHTFANLLREKLVEAGADAAYRVTHPTVGAPNFTVRADNPVSKLKAAAKAIQKDAKEFREKFSK